MYCPFKEQRDSREIICDALYSEEPYAGIRAHYPITECPQEIFNQCQGNDSYFGKTCANQLIYHDNKIFCIKAWRQGVVKSCPFYHLHDKEIAKSKCEDFEEGD